jgi:hypothetical protein
LLANALNFSIVSTYLVGKNESGNQKGNLSYLAGTKKRSDSLMQSRRGSASGRTTMTLLRERERSDDNDARAFLLSNTAEERIEALPVPPPAQLTTRSFSASHLTLWFAFTIRQAT